MKGITGVLVGVLVVSAAIGGTVWYMNTKQANEHNGSLFVSVTDATADVQDVNDVQLTVRKVEVHSATKGWVTASADPKTYNLMSLNASGRTELYAKASVPAGSYDKVRVTLGDAVVKTKTHGDVKATLPSSYVVMSNAVTVRENQDAHVALDFKADKSLHVAANANYVFAAVVGGETRSGAKVTVASDNAVSVSGGLSDSTINVGVDLDGSSKDNFVLSTDGSLQVGANNNGTIQFMVGGKNVIGGDASLDVNGMNTVNVGNTVGGSVNGSASTTSNGGASTNGGATVNVGGTIKVY